MAASIRGIRSPSRRQRASDPPRVGFDVRTPSGRVIDAGTAAPIRGALLRLLDSSGNVLWSTVTDDSGRFVLRSATAGSFRLEAQSVGYRTTVAGPVRLEYGSVTEVELRLSSTAVVLDPIRVLAQPSNVRLERVRVQQQRFGGRRVRATRIPERR